ncbi:MAG TPA: hypothetical protein VIJ57_08685, partial [Hanamia sp.]
MAPDKLKKEVKYRIDAMWSSDAIASAFFLNTDDDVLINRISDGDESALLQFIIKHVNILRRDVVDSSNRGIERQVMDICLPLFSEKIKTFAKLHANKPLPESWEYSGKYIKGLQVDYGIEEPLLDQKYKTWREFKITDRHIDFLNNLNAFLTKTEEVIVARAKIDIPLLEARIKASNSTTSDYEYFVDINFGTEASDGDPIYTASHSFNIHNIKTNDWGLLCDEEDWRESGWLP